MRRKADRETGRRGELADKAGRLIARSVIGDDDVWIFINGHLAIDMDGWHAPLEGTIAMEDGLVFAGAGRCVTCHSGAQFTDANTTLHLPSEVVSEPEPGGAPSYASRSATSPGPFAVA